MKRDPKDRGKRQVGAHHAGTRRYDLITEKFMRYEGEVRRRVGRLPRRAPAATSPPYMTRLRVVVRLRRNYADMLSGNSVLPAARRRHGRHHGRVVGARLRRSSSPSRYDHPELRRIARGHVRVGQLPASSRTPTASSATGSSTCMKRGMKTRDRSTRKRHVARRQAPICTCACVPAPTPRWRWP